MLDHNGRPYRVRRSREARYSTAIWPKTRLLRLAMVTTEYHSTLERMRQGKYDGYHFGY